jgi:hypothetical protein
MSTPEPSPAKKPAAKPAPKKTPSASTTAAESPMVSKRKGVSRGLDITLSIVFLVLNALMVAALFVPALFLAMASAGCTGSCNIDVVSAGFNIAVFGPSVAFIVNLVLSIVFLVKKRTTWLLTLLVGVGGFLVFLLGVALVFLPAS